MFLFGELLSGLKTVEKPIKPTSKVDSLKDLLGWFREERVNDIFSVKQQKLENVMFCFYFNVT